MIHTLIPQKLLTLVLATSFAASDAWAGCKFYEICGFTPGAPVQSVSTSNPGCIPVDMVAATVDNRGCVTFRACCDNIIFACTSDILVKVDGPGGLESAISAGWRCAGCAGKPESPSDFPDPPCIADVCTAGGGDPGSPIDASICSTPVSVERKSWALIKILFQ